MEYKLKEAVMENAQNRVDCDRRLDSDQLQKQARIIKSLIIGYGQKKVASGTLREYPKLNISGLWLKKLGWLPDERVFILATTEAIVVSRWKKKGVPLGCCPKPSLVWDQRSGGLISMKCENCGFSMDSGEVLMDWHGEDCMDAPECPDCYAAMSMEDTVCPECDAVVMHECRLCSRLIKADEDVCPTCGDVAEVADD